MTRHPHPARGFSLVELAMVLFIVSLLIGGLLMPLSAQNEIHGRQETDKALANIREALIGFAVVNGRLPCPADRSIASGAANAGVEAVTGAGGPCACADTVNGIATIGVTACDHDDDGSPGGVIGAVPWATLGVPETDFWGNRYTYRMTTRFGRSASGQTIFGCTPTTNPTSAAFALCSVGDMTVLTAVAGGTSIASAVPAIVVSHGRNTLGAYSSTGTLITGVTAGSDEEENADGDASFVSRASVDIDDQLIWIPGSILMGRMLAAGRLP
jgi:prepilin-type N-terminal cleavage/methylation domain-containing protein